MHLDHLVLPVSMCVKSVPTSTATRARTSPRLRFHPTRRPNGNIIVPPRAENNYAFANEIGYVPVKLHQHRRADKHAPVLTSIFHRDARA